ncbi:MAG: tetratricopeptide repeat protein [Candidatus Obscuribacterales bacterium]|jgi:tetratricopeptide (TPR) repeat protein|nr:tetratricopeptide repeat protein [Candidatus Obscuribacterales bacterium]
MVRRSSFLALKAVAALVVATALSCAVQASNIDWDSKLASGHHQLSIGNYAKAADMFASQVDKHPESAACRVALGMAQKKMGKMAEAKASFRRATEVEPDYAESHYELGAMLENDKEYKEACQCFERYMQLAPSSTKRASVEERIRYCRENI